MDTRKVRVCITPELQAEMDGGGRIRIYTVGASYPLEMIVSRLVKAWALHFGEEERQIRIEEYRKEVNHE